MSDSESTAKERLVTLLDYADEVSKLNTRTSEEDSSLQLLGGFESDEGKAIVLHEDVLLRLAEVKQDDGSGVPCCHFATPSAPSSRAGVWMRLSRPDSTEVRDAGAGKLLCSIYASLYSTHQEALREGRGAQVTAGVGILRWKRASDGKIIDHPLVTIAAELHLDSDGALVIRMADGAQASLWSIPGIADAAQAVRRLLESAKQGDFATALFPDGILSTAAPPSPADRAAWAPLLKRATYELAHDTVYVDGPPKTAPKGSLATAPDHTPRVHNGFVIYARQDAGELGITHDVAALKEVVRSLERGALPSAHARLTGIYDLPATPALPVAAPATSVSFLARLFGLGGGVGDSPTASGSSGGAAARPPLLYFGLPANAAQQAVVERLATHGCCVLVGPPGTGKSQTIANVICHYLACGRRVLVTSKGEPATEVLRQKLPPGVRELTVSLGSGDAASYRRLEAAVENLASQVANADPKKLAGVTERKRRQLDAIDAELASIELSEKHWAQPYFPPPLDAPDSTAGARSISGHGASSSSSISISGLAKVPLHAEHLVVLGLTSPETATLTQLADTVMSVLHPEGLGSVCGPSGAGCGVSSPSTATATFKRQVAGTRAFFLADETINPLKPPPSQDLIESIRALRRQCKHALQWGTALRSRAVRTEDAKASDLLRLAGQLLERSRIEHAIIRHELPRIAEGTLEEARRLVAVLSELRADLLTLESCVAAQADHAAAAATATACSAATSSSYAATAAASTLAGAHDGASTGKAKPKGSKAKGSARDGACTDVRWLLSMLRHADSPPARHAMATLVAKAQRMVALATSVASASKVYVPPEIMKSIDDSCSKAELLEGGLLSLGSDAEMSCEALVEVSWRAHPERRGLLDQVRRRVVGAPGGETLDSNLNGVRVEGLLPATARDWALVERVLQVR